MVPVSRLLLMPNSNATSALRQHMLGGLSLGLAASTGEARDMILGE